MNTFTRYLKLLCLAVMMLAAVAHRAHAIPLNGTATFGGTGSGMQGAGISTLTFNNPIMLLSGAGDYMSLPNGTPAIFAPISWTGQGTNVFLTSSNNPEWTVVFGGSTYQFNLLALNNATLNLSAGTISLEGIGVATLSGAVNRDPTLAILRVQGTLSNLNLMFETANYFPPPPRVPEAGSSIALLLLGVTGLGVLRRKWPAAESRAEMLPIKT